MTDAKNEAACGASRSDAVLADEVERLTNKLALLHCINGTLRADAERWRWLASDCDGDAQDDFTRWLAGTVAPKYVIDAEIDEAMKAANAKVSERSAAGAESARLPGSAAGDSEKG